MDDLRWSPAEKKIARAAFDRAYERECDTILQEVQAMLSGTQDSQVVWKIEEHITKRRRHMELRYDYRYSMLIMIFAGMIHDKVLTEEELAGLATEKIQKIRRMLGG